jgi:predicted RNA-binding protein
VTYWLDLFSEKTWREFLDSGANVSGFRDGQWTTVQKIAKGDRLLCYLTRVSRFVGILEVTSDPFRDSTKIWADEDFPCRIKVKPVATLTAEMGIPIKDLTGKVSFLPDGNLGMGWGVYVRSSPKKWKASDGAVVTQAIADAVKNPVVRPLPPKPLTRPKTVTGKIGPVTIPGIEDNGEPEAIPQERAREHTEIQWTLLKLGADLGFDVWVARNDRGRSYNGQPFATLERIKDRLPLQFDQAIKSTIELIDVLWLRGNVIVAAFEIESTTSIYSGLLRMADLIAMLQNINIPLYLVAPEERRSKVMIEVNRPTFKRLTPPLSTICRYIGFNVLRKQIEHIAGMVKYLKPEFLEELSESCELDD